jgi:glycosyltransferase involved in cell wall biosynthesis
MINGPRVSVIICTYDKRRVNDLDECMNSVLAQLYNNFEVLIVVDHNENFYRTLINKYRDQRVRIVLNNLELGQAASMNYGILNAKGEIICFIDDDAVADENWLLELINGYNCDTYAVAGRTEPLWVSEKPSYLPEEFYWMVGAVGSYLPNEVKEIRNLWSGNISYRRETFGKVGLFSQDLGRAGNPLFQGEDAEFGLKLSKTLGKGVKYVPTARVYHKVYSSRVKFSSLLRRAYEQGYAKAYIKKLHNDVDALSMERGYANLLFKSSLKRLKHILFGPGRIDALKQLTFAFIATMTVFLGFISGSIRTKL